MCIPWLFAKSAGGNYDSAMRSWPLICGIAALASAGLQTGCAPTSDSDPKREIAALKEKLDKQSGDLASRQAAIDELNKQLAVCRGISNDDLKRIFYPEKLVIASLSGGENYDSQPGDDGVTVYLQPVDRKGDVLKVAGDIRIELYDLASPTGQNQIGVYNFPIDKAVDLWYGQLMTYHYSLRCPWQSGPPKHSEITIRATFVDFLTKRVMAAQSVVKVKLAGTPG